MVGGCRAGPVLHGDLYEGAGVSSHALPVADHREVGQACLSQTRTEVTGLDSSAVASRRNGNFTRGLVIGMAIVLPFWAVVIGAFVWFR